MKRFLSVFLAVILIVSSFSITCFADNPVELKLSSETNTIYAGDEFVVKLMISDNSKVSGAVIDINYDKDKLEYVSSSFGGILDESATKSIKNISGSKSKVTFAYLAPDSEITSQGVLFSVKFRARENVTGSSELTISIPTSGDFISKDSTRLSYVVENAKIEIINSVTETETESETETETEKQIVESTTKKKTTKNNDNDDGNKTVDKTILIVVIVGAVILFIAILLARKPKSKSKKKKRRR